MIRTTFDHSLPYTYLRYGRMSHESQNPRSPDQQFDTIDVELKRAAYQWAHVVDYRDDAISGRLLRKRPGFCQMLNDVKTGRVRVDLILVDTYERFGRADEFAALRRELHSKYGVLILTADSRFTDPTSVAGKALGFVESIRATSDAHVKAHNVLRGKIDAARLRHWPGGPAPVGYKLRSVMKPNTEPAEIDYRTLVPDPETSPVPLGMFTLARENGWGGGRIAKHLNQDVEFVVRYGKVGASKVDYVLGNPIYVGTLRFNRFATDIVDDRRVAARNDQDEVVYVEEFCEPIVRREVWDAVQQQRRQRSERIRSARARKREPGGRQIKPLAPGIALKYPLSGLVRCSECGSAMRPTKGGGLNYHYYACPASLDARCSNRRKVRGDWLWRIFVARLRERLFRLPEDGTGAAPVWLEELVGEIRAELLGLAARNQDRRPQLQRALAEIESKTAGWTQSLANPILPTAVRQRIEAEFNQAIVRKQQVETELAGLNHEARRADEMLDVDAAVERLLRLDAVLARGNPTEMNVELARHVEQIAVHPDGRVIVRTHWLGLFEGLTELLALPAGKDGPPETDERASQRSDAVKPRHALLTRHISNLGPVDGSSIGPSRVPLGFVKLPEKWVEQDVVRTPERHCWAHLHAQEVGEKRTETAWSQRKLAKHFGVTPPTIRHALRIAAAQSDSQA